MQTVDIVLVVQFLLTFIMFLNNSNDNNILCYISNLFLPWHWAGAFCSGAFQPF